MAELVSNKTVRIQIGDDSYDSPDPTTGSDLHILGGVGPDQSLFRDVSGDEEGEELENDQQEIKLRGEERFQIRPKKVYTIVVNGQRKTVKSKTISFEQLVKLAFPSSPGGENILYSITYSKGPLSNPHGSLLPGQSVKIQDGMIFNVTATDKS